MRNINQIQTVIDHKQKTLKNHEKRIYEINKEISKLQDLKRKVIDKNELKNNGVNLNIVSIENISKNYYPEYLFKTNEGLSFISHRIKSKLLKNKKGIYRVSKHFYEQLKDCKFRKEQRIRVNLPNCIVNSSCVMCTEYDKCLNGEI